ncbi:MAG: hypothetical protein IJN10_01990, partial [Firmicutes bacterium]|nr:hypothetical protein [Bacillota bacterium]
PSAPTLASGTDFRFGFVPAAFQAAAPRSVQQFFSYASHQPAFLCEVKRIAYYSASSRFLIIEELYHMDFSLSKDFLLQQHRFYAVF